MNKRIRGLSLAFAAASMAVLFTGTAFADGHVVTTADGLLTVTLPNEKWVEVPGVSNTEVFSDGDCAILFDIYRSTDQLPPVPSADDLHPIVYSSSTANPQFIFLSTGLISRAEDYEAVRAAIDGVVVNNEYFNESMLIHSIAQEEYSIDPVSLIAIVSADELNVRDASSTEGTVLTSLFKGEEVKVTGIIKKNGSEIGWARVNIKGMDGYVASQFLTPIQSAQVAAQSQSSAPAQGNSNTSSSQSNSSATVTKTGNTLTLYTADGTSTHIYEYTNGVWMNDFGGVFTYAGPSTWIDPSGQTVYDYNPSQGTDFDHHEEDIVAPVGMNDFYVYNDLGAALSLHDGGDGYYYTYDCDHQYVRTNAGTYIDTSDHDSVWHP